MPFIRALWLRCVQPIRRLFQNSLQILAQRKMKKWTTQSKVEPIYIYETHAAQLYRYFSATDARFTLLTKWDRL